MGFLRSDNREPQGPIITLFLALSAMYVVRSAPSPGFVGHPFPYFLHYPVVPFNSHLSPHFNSIQPPLVAQLAHSQQFFPQQWFQNQNPQFTQNQTSPTPTRQGQSLSGQDGSGANSRTQFQQPQIDIADIRARLAQQNEKKNKNQTAQTQRSNNGNAANSNPPVTMQMATLNGNVNRNNAVGQNNFNFGFGQPQNFGQNFGNLRDQQGGLPITSQINTNFPWQNQADFGWGWDNSGWNTFPINPTPPSSSGGSSTPSAAQVSTGEDNSEAQIAMDGSDLARQRNFTSFNSKSSTTALNTLANNGTMVSSRPSISTEIPVQKYENPLTDAVEKFRRIVTQIREITRNELKS